VQLSRLLLDPTGGDPPLEVRFDPDIALVPAAGSDAGRVRSALEAVS
jgi:hypothetical protein